MTKQSKLGRIARVIVTRNAESRGRSATTKIETFLLWENVGITTVVDGVELSSQSDRYLTNSLLREW